MAWGGFCGTTKSELVFIPGKAKLDSAMYVETVMEPYLVPFWHQCCEEYGWTRVIENGAPGHQKYARIYRQKNEIDAVPWPAQSPDLNLIEALLMDLETELGVVFVTGRGGAGFHSAGPALTRGRGGIFRVIPAPPPPGAYPHSFPGRGPVCYHPFLAGTRPGYGWGGGLSGDRGRECRKRHPAPGR